MKHFTLTLASHRGARFAFAALSVLFSATTLRASSCAVGDMNKWHPSAIAAAPDARTASNGAALEGVGQGTQAAAVMTDVDRTAALLAINGLWKITFYDGPNATGNVTDVAFDAWQLDGLEILNDYTPPQAGNVCLGTFKPTGRNTYQLTHPAWLFDLSGNPTGIEMLYENVTLSRDRNTMTGTYTIAFFDLTGTLSAGPSLTGSLMATRIEP
jgi:hypothetical protein